MTLKITLIKNIIKKTLLEQGFRRVSYGLMLRVVSTLIFTIMAKTNGGKKKVYVAPHRKSNGTKVKTHYRSTPN